MLGRSSGRAVLRELSLREFFEWQAFNELEPIGGVRGDYHAAQIVTALANLLGRDPKKQPTPYELKDFLLVFGEPDGPTRTQSNAEKVRLLRAWAGYAAGTPDDEATGRRRQPARPPRR